MDQKVFGMFIAAERKKSGMTQQALANQLHVTDKAVSKWERGLCYPDLTLMENLASALDLTMTELVSCERQEKPKHRTAQEDHAVKSALTISGEALQTQRKNSVLEFSACCWDWPPLPVWCMLPRMCPNPGKHSS